MKYFKLALLVSMVTLTSCDSIKGTGTINKRMQVRKKPNAAETILVEAGQYNAEIAFGRSSSKITLKNGSLNYTIPFVAPRGAQDGVDFSYNTVETGQTFGVRGSNRVNTTRSSESARSRSCVLRTYSVPYSYCYPEQRVCRRYERDCRRVDRDRDGRSRRECRESCASWSYEPGRCETRFRTENEYGSETLYGYNETTQATLTVELLEGASRSGVLSFVKDPSTRWVTTNSTGCR